MVEKEHLPLENSPGHGNAQIGVFRHRGAFWAEYFVFLCHMGLIIFQTPYPEKIINKIGAHEFPWGPMGAVARATDAKLGANGVAFRPGFDGTAPGPPNP